jgi:solute carrier family 35 protein F1/2
MLVMYTVAPLLYRLASSTYYNLSLRSASFYGLLFGTSSISNPVRLYLTRVTGIFLFVRFTFHFSLCC